MPRFVPPPDPSLVDAPQRDASVGWGSGGGWSNPPDVDVGDGVPVANAALDPAERYAVGALLGRGGMGAVHAARDLRLGRDVAFKEVVNAGSIDPRAEARLAREAAITARLDHPGIVAVHDIGRLPDGRLFYTMRLVRGRTLARAVALAADDDARRRLARDLLAAAEAVAAAHEAGVVHRDLKPDNILIGAHGETQVVDWGLASPTPSAAGRWADLPGAGATGPVGTPRWMAPEQAAGEPPDPTHDVYSLGLILTWAIGGASGALPAELAAIAARATAARAGDRYPDAASFAADLLAWFEGRRVGAHAYTPGQLLRRTVRAYRAPLSVAGVGLLVVVLAVALGWTSSARSLRRALAAESAAAEALTALQIERAVEATRSGAREAAETLALSALLRHDDPLARGVFAAFGRVDRPRALGAEAGPDCAWSSLPPGAPWVLCGDDGEVSRWERGAVRWRAPISARGGWVVGDEVRLIGATGELWALDAETGAQRASWPRAYDDWVAMAGQRRLLMNGLPLDLQRPAPSGCEGELHVAAVRADGRVAAVCGDGSLLLGDPRAGPPLRVPTGLVGDHVAMAIAWAPDGTVVVGSLRGRIFTFSGQHGAVRSVGDTALGAIFSITVSPDGRLLAIDGAEGGVGLWSLRAGAMLAELPAARPRSVAFTTDGLLIHDGALRAWRPPVGAPAVLRADAGLADISVSADGLSAVTVGGEGWVGVADLRDGSVRRFGFGDRVVKAAVFGPGGVVATGLGGPGLAVATPDGAWRPLAAARGLRRVAALADGSVVGLDFDDGIFRWMSPDSAPTRLARGRLYADMERDGEALILLDADGQVDRLDAAQLTPLVRRSGARAAAARGALLAVAHRDAVWLRGPTGERTLEAPGSSLLDVAVSPDLRRVAAGAVDGLIRVWDVETGALVGILPGHRERVVAVEFSPEGDLLSASWDHTARIFDLSRLDQPLDALSAEVEAAWPGAR